MVDPGLTIIFLDYLPQSHPVHIQLRWRTDEPAQTYSIFSFLMKNFVVSQTAN
jgi:hypothetical protein